MRRNTRRLVLASVPCQDALGLKHTTLTIFLGLLFYPCMSITP